MQADRKRVLDAFDAAGEYAGHAIVQRRIARQLAVRIAALGCSASQHILELGCGTGFLTRELLEQGVGGSWTITDKAPAMVKRCKSAIGGGPNRRFAVLDGEYGLEGHKGAYDLICSSMAMQWFDDLGPAVGRLVERLTPGGHLVFNTLASGTFSEWRGAHRDTGWPVGAIGFPTIAALRERLAQYRPAAFAVDHQVESHANAREFLARLKAIGAATSQRDHRPLSPRALKQVMAQFDRNGARTTYEVVTCHIMRGVGR